MLVCGPTIYNYFPLNLPSPAPKEGLKVMTFNTHCFGNLEDGIEINDAKGNNVVAKFIMEKAPDLVGYQEGVAPKKFKANVQPLLNRHGYYADSVSFSGNRLGCFSKFPIAEKQVLCQNDGNGAVLFKLLPPQQDTIFFIVAHLQTMRLNKEDRKDFLKNISQLLPDELAEQFTFDPFWRIAKKIATSSAPRAQQADKLAQFIESHADRRIILCGDFNDTPVSYTYRTIRQAGPLDDAFVATGNGMGRTFNKNAMMVRIDHIFYNANVWSAHASRIHDEKEMSDHYAVTTCLQEL